MELVNLGFLLTVTYCTHTSALPVTYPRLENMPIGKFAEIIENIRNIDSKQDFQPSRTLDKSYQRQDDEKSHYGLFLSLGDSIQLNDITNDNPEDIPNVEKRQGDWDFDYGLGGGRWGKRSYSSYGLSKYRIGRDVDHVDPYDPED